MKKVFLTLGLGCLAFSLESAAFRRVGAFASKVLFSKVGAAAGALATYNGIKAIENQVEWSKQIANCSTFVHPEIDNHLQAFFKRHGVENVKCIYVDDPVFLGAFKDYKGFNAIYFGRFAAHMLETQKPFLRLDNGEIVPLPVKELLACLEHEVDHLKHDDILEREIVQRVSLPLTLLVTKAARVTGKSKFASVGVGLGCLTAYSCLSVVRECMQEKRCDLSTSSSDSARCMVGVLEKRKKIGPEYLFYEKKKIEESLEFSTLSFSEQLALRLKLAGVAMARVGIGWGIISLEHFPISIRASYLEEHAKRLEQTEQLGVVSDVQKTADAIEETLIRLIEEEEKAKS